MNFRREVVKFLRFDFRRHGEESIGLGLGRGKNEMGNIHLYRRQLRLGPCVDLLDRGPRFLAL